MQLEEICYFRHPLHRYQLYMHPTPPTRNNSYNRLYHHARTRMITIPNYLHCDTCLRSDLTLTLSMTSPPFISSLVMLPPALETLDVISLVPEERQLCAKVVSCYCKWAWTGTWKLVPLPAHAVPITYRWIYKVKTHLDGLIEHYKAYLVTHDFC